MAIFKAIGRFFQWLFCCKSSKPGYPVFVTDGQISINNSALSLNTFAEIVSYLSFQDACQLSSTCTALKSLLSSNKDFLKEVMKTNWKVFILADKKLKQDIDLQKLAFEGYNRDEGESRVCGDLATLENLFKIPFFRQNKDVVLAAVPAEDFLEAN